MARDTTFIRDDVLPSYFANALGDILSTLVANFRVRLKPASTTIIQVPAGATLNPVHPANGRVALSVDGAWRWIDADVERAHPGGAAGTYDIFVTAAANSVNNTPLPFTDHTNRAFALAIVASGGSPTVVPGTVDLFRKVGSLQWDGLNITQIDLQVNTPPTGLPADGPAGQASLRTLGTGAQQAMRGNATPTPAAHAASHALAGSDPVVKTYQVGHTWTVRGTIAVPSGQADYIPPMRVPVNSPETVKIARVEYRLNNGASGVSASFKIQRNGADIAGFGTSAAPLVAGGATNTTNWAETDPSDVVLTDRDEIALVITAVSGSPQNLSVTVVLELAD